MVQVFADSIKLTEGGNIASATVGSGAGGDVIVTADTIDVVGVDPTSFFPSTITASTAGSGDAGNVTVNTRQIALQDGGRVDSSSLSTGDAGTVTINATELVSVTGRFWALLTRA